MGDDEAALFRLWREKRGEVEPEDLSGNLIVQLGLVTEPLNRSWYQRNTGRHALRPHHFSAHKRLFVGFDFERFPQAHSRSSPVLVDKLHTGTPQHILDCSERCCIAGVPADLNIGDRVPMEAGRFREVPDGPIQCRPSHSYLCTCHS